jgi:hypothetical protein
VGHHHHGYSLAQPERINISRLIKSQRFVREKEIIMRKYHHLGIPTHEKREGETYLESFKMYVSGYENSPYGVEWMRFEPDCPLPELVKTIPHIAFEVDDLNEELEGQEILIEPNCPSEGIIVAFIVHNGVPVEFLQMVD